MCLVANQSLWGLLSKTGSELSAEQDPLHTEGGASQGGGRGGLCGLPPVRQLLHGAGLLQLSISCSCLLDPGDGRHLPLHWLPGRHGGRGHRAEGGLPHTGNLFL